MDEFSGGEENGNPTVAIDGTSNLITWREPSDDVEFTKTDEEGNLLAEAQMEEQRADKSVVEGLQWTSEAGVPYKSTGKLNPGETYYLVETKAPAGYTIAEPKERKIRFAVEKEAADVDPITREIMWKEPPVRQREMDREMKVISRQ